MRTSLFLLVPFLSLAACAQQPPLAQQAPPPLYVSSTSIVQRPPAPSARPRPSFLASQVLVGEEADYFTWRFQNSVAGNIPIAGATALTTYTYDAQNISAPGGVGYRYRWIVQDGISAPNVP